MQKKYFGVNSTKVKKLGIQKIGKIEELKFSKTNVKYVVAEKHLLYSIFPTPPKKYYEYERVVTRKYTQSLRESYTIINKSDFGEHIEKDMIMFLFLCVLIVRINIPTREREKYHNIYVQNADTSLMNQFTCR